MEEKVFDALQTLAGQFNTTVEFLWGVLLKQALVDGSLSVFTAAFFLIAGVWIQVTLSKAKDLDSESWCIATFVLWAFCGPVIFFNIQSALTSLINPEYWALRQVLRLL